MLNKFLSLIVAFISLVILCSEFFYDLKKELLLKKLVSFLDITLLVIYFSLVCIKIYQNRESILSYIRQKKADTFLVLLVTLFSFMPRVASALVIIRFFIALLLKCLESRLGHRLLANLNLRPSQTLALSFVGLILSGTILLTFPASTTNGRGASFLNALFTMTSASCVSGLTIFDIGSYFTKFGQWVILLGMQAGGLGIMVLSAAFAVLVGGTIPSRRQAGLREVLDVSSPEGLKALIKAITATTIVTELIGACALFFLWRDNIPQTTERIWYAIFHSVSAFCNAGISLYKNSLNNFIDSWPVCMFIMVLITIGGIGFFVISDISNADVWQIKRPKAIWARLQVQTKVVLISSLLLNAVGMLLFLFFEFDGALHGLTADKKILASLFQAVSLRSAGFTVISIDNIIAPTILFSIAYMFIGAAPGSTGGGIKVTTTAVSIMALRAMLRGRNDVELSNRSMPADIVSRSLSIVLVAGIFILVFLTLLLATQGIKFEKLFFEAVSAFGTVGLSIDTTGKLNHTGRLLIICLMFIGRIGPLTLALAIGEKKVSTGYKLPKGRIAVG